MDGEAVIYKREVTIHPTNKAASRYRFVLKGANGEIIATSEAYNSKQAATDTLKTYFYNFDLVDETNE